MSKITGVVIPKITHRPNFFNATKHCLRYRLNTAHYNTTRIHTYTYRYLLTLFSLHSTAINCAYLQYLQHHVFILIFFNKKDRKKNT